MGSESQSGSPSGCPSVSHKPPDFLGRCVTTGRRGCIAVRRRLLRWPGRRPRHPGAVFVARAGASAPGVWRASLTAPDSSAWFSCPGRSPRSVEYLFFIVSVFRNPVSSHFLNNR